MIRSTILGLYAMVFLWCYAYGQRSGILAKESQQSNVSLNPCLVGHWSQATVWNVEYDELRDLIFLGSCGCIYVLDVSDPSKPEQLSYFNHSLCNTCGFFYDPNEQILYVCSGASGLTIWSLSDPTQPVKLGKYDTPGYASSIDVMGHYAFVACADAGLCVLDVTHSDDPKEVGHFEMTSATCLHVSGRYAYIADLGLRILDISNPTTPMEISYYETPGVAFGLDVIDGHAYVADDWCGLRIIDISEPKNPHEVGYFLTPGYAWGVYVANSLAYVSACEEGLRVIDFTDVSDPREIAHYETSEAIVNALTYGSHIYMADAADGLRIVSMTTFGN
jgi:hypothetical protein